MVHSSTQCTLVNVQVYTQNLRDHHLLLIAFFQGHISLKYPYNAHCVFLDRHASAEPKVREDEEVKFKEVSEAYSILSDSQKKMRYDNGQDLEDMGMGGARTFNHSTMNCRGFNYVLYYRF